MAFRANIRKLLRLNSHSSDYASSCSDEEEESSTMIREQLLLSPSAVDIRHGQQQASNVIPNQPSLNAAEQQSAPNCGERTLRDRVPVSGLNRRVNKDVGSENKNGNGGNRVESENNRGEVVVNAGEADDKENASYPIMYSRQSSIRRSNRGAGSVNRNAGTVHRGRRRLVRKNGKSLLATVAEGWQTRRKYGQDLVNTIVNSRWRWTLFILSSCYFGCWFLFALLYMVIAMANGDQVVDPSKNPTCFGGIVTFGGYLMFSIETQQTIGYGSRFIKHYCPEAVFVMCCQLIFSSAICGGMLSIAYMKLSNNKMITRSSSLFSKNAVICLRDGVLCLIFRMRDITGRYQVGTTINAYLVQSRSEPHEPLLKALQLEPQGVIFWPLEVVHKITADSPFFNLSAKDLVGSKMFEFIVTLQGTSVHTGQCSKSKTSYLSTEVKWGHRFKPCVSFNKLENKYIVNHDLFHKTEEVVIPLCSAQLLSEVILDMGPNMNNYMIPPIVIDQIPDSTIEENHESAKDSPLPIEVYQYVQQIKENTLNDNTVPVNQNIDRIRSKDSTTLDVELLISSLQNFVENNIIENKGRILNETDM